MKYISCYTLISLIILVGCSDKSKSEEEQLVNVDTTKYDVKFLNNGDFKSDESHSLKFVENSIAGSQNKMNRFLKGTRGNNLYFGVGDFPIGGVTSKSKKTADLIKDVFNSTGLECLPSSNKIRKFANNKVPETLTLHSQDSVMSYYEGIPGILVLSSFKVKRTNGRIEDYSLPSGRVGVSSILDLINPGDANSYIYQMDCSGYFSFALSIATKRIPVAEVNAAGNSSIKGTKSSIVAYGKFTSPLAIAIKPGSAFNLQFDNPTRKQVLQNILSAPSPEIQDGDSVIVNNYYYLLITSTNGSSGFTGKFDITAAAGGGIGVLSGSTSASAGATYSRSVRFTDYNTYVSSRLDNSQTNETKIKGSELKAALVGIP